MRTDDDASADAPRRRAVLFDFGGVLTTSVIAAFTGLDRALGAEPGQVLRLLSKDAQSSALLVAHEEGRIGEREFEHGFAARLRAHGIEAGDAEGRPRLLSRLQAGLRPDTDMVALVTRLRADGYRVGLLSNSLGDDCYAGFDLPALFDAVTVSGEIGVRKPSRRAYAIACERLGVRPGETVMVDDLEQNITAAARLGIAGVLHRTAPATTAALARLLGPADPH